jgi:hypothetical protein
MSFAARRQISRYASLHVASFFSISQASATPTRSLMSLWHWVLIQSISDRTRRAQVVGIELVKRSLITAARIFRRTRDLRLRQRGNLFNTFDELIRASAARRPQRASEPDALDYLASCSYEFGRLAKFLANRSQSLQKGVELGPDDICAEIKRGQSEAARRLIDEATTSAYHRGRAAS